jgi:hypothetical protein
VTCQPRQLPRPVEGIDPPHELLPPHIPFFTVSADPWLFPDHAIATSSDREIDGPVH